MPCYSQRPVQKRVVQDAKIDIQHIRLEQRIDWQSKSLDGGAEITLKILESGRKISLT